MQGRAYDLTPERVRERLEQITDLRVIEELYTFGCALLSETREVRSRLESKSLSVLTWSVAIIGFVYTQVKATPEGGLLKVLFVVAALAATFAIVSAYLAIKSQSRAISSDEDWFECDSLDSADDLKLYHVRSLHEVKYRLAKTSSSKARFLTCAETCISIAGLALTAAIMVSLFGVRHP